MGCAQEARREAEAEDYELLSVAPCTCMHQEHMNALTNIYNERAISYKRGQRISFDEGPNGQENVQAVKDALASVNRIDPGGCHIVMDCLVFFERFRNISNDEDVYCEHCGQHPQNIRRLLKHKGGRTVQRFMEKYHDQFMALTERLKEERRAYLHAELARRLRKSRVYAFANPAETGLWVWRPCCSAC